jgi:hypothetical protein
MEVPLKLTPEWVVEEFEENGYESLMGSAKTVGAKQVLANFLRANAMKVSGMDNKERWTRIVRFCVPAERKHADPAHYKRFPFRAFYADPRFWRHHYAMLFAFVHNTYFQQILMMVLFTQVHRLSHELYTKPMIYLGNNHSCSRIPGNIGCSQLRFLQEHSFNALDDIYKFFSVMISQFITGKVFRRVVPLQAPAGVVATR